MERAGMRVHGHSSVGSGVPTLRVYCEAHSPYHEKRGRTWLATFAKDRDAGTWREVQPRSQRVAGRERAWLDNLTPEDEARVMAGEDAGPFGNDVTAGFREPALTYMRGDEPAPDSEQRRVAEALTTGRRDTARGSVPASPEDLAGRVKLDLDCRCGEPPVRQRGERVWPVLDALLGAGVGEVSLATLRAALSNYA